MKTKVKEFILDNMTDENFEKLVNMLITEKARLYHIHDPELMDTVSNYLSQQLSSYPKNNTFEILNQIKKVCTAYLADYRNHLPVDGLEVLNDISTSFMPSENTLEEMFEKMKATTRKEIKNLSGMPREHERELEISDAELDFLSNDSEQIDNSEYIHLQNVNFAFIPNEREEYEDYEDKIHELNIDNYEEIIHREIIQTALGLANFIYEVLHFSNESKWENNFKEASNEESLVRITNDDGYESGYSVLFHLDSRSRYISNEMKEAYRKRLSEMVSSDGWRIFSDGLCEFPVKLPKFIEYSELIEDLEMGPEYILAPFTFYLNEELLIPNTSYDNLYDILEKLIHILIFQGFTKAEQLTQIMDFNEVYMKVNE